MNTTESTERFRAKWRMPRRKNVEYGPIEPTAELAESHAPPNCHLLVVLRDSGGSDHPDNAGKFFNHRIVR